MTSATTASKHRAAGTTRLRQGTSNSASYRRCYDMKTHGMTNSRLYHIWKSMKARCYNPKHESYYLYGGRGITICPEWRNSFEAFRDWAYSTGYNDKLSIDRIDNNGNYTPENCRWATPKAQARNRSTSRYINIGNISMTLVEWAEIIGLSPRSITIASQRGISPESYIRSKLPNVSF